MRSTRALYIVLVGRAAGFAPADKATLQAALGNWDSDETAAATTYGAVASWDVTAVADFSELMERKASQVQDTEQSSTERHVAHQQSKSGR